MPDSTDKRVGHDFTIRNGQIEIDGFPLIGVTDYRIEASATDLVRVEIRFIAGSLNKPELLDPELESEPVKPLRTIAPRPEPTRPDPGRRDGE